MIIPIVSIAKRSLRRRKLRFALTLTSVLLLVASFISLTSFNSGYGLTFSKTKSSVMKEGVMIKTPNPPPEKTAAPFSGGTGVAGPLPLDETLIQWYGQLNEIANIAPRFENIPSRQYRELYDPVANINQTPIFGIVSINPKLEAEINLLDSALIEGDYLNGTIDETLISKKLAEKNGVKIGDTITLETHDEDYELIVVGLFNDYKLETLTDIDGKSLLPSKIIEWDRIELDGPDYVVEALVPCSSDEVIWINLITGKNMTALWLHRINLILQEDVNIMDFARSTALNRGHRAWASTLTGIYLAELTEYFEGKGLPIVIPWIIVVLNVIVTMMNAYYERRYEVMIYSSIGMNPRHISSIFLAEATVIGVLGGCIGYLIGLGAYKLIFILTPVLQVKQKVSAFWSIAAIFISMIAVLVGGLSALLNSTSITPSLRRRWNIENEQEYSRETKIVIPIQAYEEEIEDYIDFIYKKIKNAERAGNLTVKMLRLTQVSEKKWEFWFVYSSANSQIAALYSKNRIIVEKNQGKTYSTILNTIGDSDSIKEAGSLIRRIGLDWSVQRERGYRNGKF
jgi:ABC-type lipoprotein release transport system permease subunit